MSLCFAFITESSYLAQPFTIRLTSILFTWDQWRGGVSASISPIVCSIDNVSFML